MIYGYKGYGSAGASIRKRSTKGFTAQSGSPREDIDENNYTLRQRGRLMYMGNPVAASAIKTHRTNTVGLGLRLNPRPDLQVLGMTQDEATEWAHKVKREFQMWAGRKDACDATGLNDFYELQQLMLTAWLTSGDVFALIQNRDTTPMRPYSLRIRAIEADLVDTPDDMGGGLYTMGRNPQTGNRVFDGVEVDGMGMVVAYHIRNTYPYENTIVPTEFKRIEARGKDTGMPNILAVIWQISPLCDPPPPSRISLTVKLPAASACLMPSISE